jgi:hypothetical protein
MSARPCSVMATRFTLWLSLRLSERIEQQILCTRCSLSPRVLHLGSVKQGNGHQVILT